MRQGIEIPDERESQIFDGTTGEAIPPPATGKGNGRIDLSKIRDVRLEMAAVYRDVKRGKRNSQDGSRLIFMLRQIGDMIVIADLEKRLMAIEERHVEALTGPA